MEEETIKAVMEILTEWNPLGERASQIKDLENYKTEAVDILMALSLFQNSHPADLIRSVLNQAFDLSLTSKECKKVASKITKILQKLDPLQ